jgi:DNA-binding beta-propeller fold protein YncE
MPRKRRRSARGFFVLVGLAALAVALVVVAFHIRPWFATRPYPGMPPVVSRSNIYSEAGRNRFSPATAGALERIYVPAIRSSDVTVIDPRTFRVVDRFKTGKNAQHVVPAWDLRRLWVTGSATPGRRDGSLTPIDPLTGKPGPIVPVPDAYNMYFTPDGHAAIVVAEAQRRLEFRDPHTMQFESALPVRECDGINHADFAADGSYAIFTCEFGGGLVKLDLRTRRIVGHLLLSRGRMPQDIRLSPDGRVFYVADMMADGVFLIDGERFVETGFIPTGIGAHGLAVSRDGTKLYVSNRGAHSALGPPHGPGSISVIDFATRRVERTWPIPGGGSPDMGNVSADGKTLWLSGRFDDVAYAIDTTTGAVRKIPVGREPHGLAVWPQPGRYCLGHTGIMR